MAKMKLPSTAGGRRKLVKLADLLESDAKNRRGIKFDLGMWGAVDKDGDELSVSCGTTACAMGLAALSGEFSGLRHKNSYGDLNFMWRGVERWDGIAVAQELFGITEGEAQWLFYEESYYGIGPTTGAKAERIVAKRIRDFVAGRASPS